MELNILISSAGRRGALVDCFRDAGHALGIELRVCAADLRPELSSACHLADHSFAVPPCDAADYVDVLLERCRRERIRLVVPTIDTELATLSRHRDRFAEAGIHVAVSAPEVVAIAGDKQRTATVLAAAGVSVPRTVTGAHYAADSSALTWPIILKPRAGSASIGLVRPGSVGEAQALIGARPDMVAQELWSGREYTVNLFFARDGVLRCAVPHWRIETRAGELSKGRTEDVGMLRDVARQIAQCLPGAAGALCFQAIINPREEYCVFEINARFGGGYPLAHRAGARFAQWLLEEALGRPSTASDRWRSGVTMLRYDAAVYHDE